MCPDLFSEEARCGSVLVSDSTVLNICLTHRSALRCTFLCEIDYLYPPIFSVSGNKNKYEFWFCKSHRKK